MTHRLLRKKCTVSFQNANFWKGSHRRNILHVRQLRSHLDGYLEPDSSCENQPSWTTVKLPFQKEGRYVRSGETSLLRAREKTQGSELPSSLLVVNVQEQLPMVAYLYNIFIACGHFILGSCHAYKTESLKHNN